MYNFIKTSTAESLTLSCGICDVSPRWCSWTNHCRLRLHHKETNLKKILSFSLSFEIAEVRFYMYTIYQSLHLNLLHISNDYLLLDCLRFWAVDPVEPIVHWFNINPIHQGAEFPFNQSSVFTYYQIRSLIDCIII